MIEIHSADLEELIEAAMNRGARWERSRLRDQRQWTQWRADLVKMGVETAGLRAKFRGAPDRAKVAKAQVAGAIANLMRETPSNDPSFPGIRKAYEVALLAAGLVSDPQSGV